MCILPVSLRLTYNLQGWCQHHVHTGLISTKCWGYYPVQPLQKIPRMLPMTLLCL